MVEVQRPSFDISVAGHRMKSGVWRIDARLSFRRHLRRGVDTQLLHEGRIAFLKAILEENSRGRMQGATVAKVFLDFAGDKRHILLEGGGEEISD